MSRVETIGNATLYLGDCREILPTLGRVDAVVTDPPYGIGQDNYKYAAGKNRGKTRVNDYGNVDWDTECAPAWIIQLLREISGHQIIFGGNYYNLPPSPCWLIWDKKNTGNCADCEMAWTNMEKGTQKIEWLWNGMCRKGSDVREHPTQKPLGVMAWVLDQLPDDVKQVCDPFMGSGTTGVAAIQKDLAFIGIEREPKYFEIACERLSEAIRQPKLFSRLADTVIQMTWDEMWSEPFDKPELIADNGNPKNYVSK